MVQIWQLKEKFKLRRSQLLMGVVYAIVIALFLYLTNENWPGYYKTPHIIADFKILLQNGSFLEGIVTATIILVIPAFIIIFLVGIASDNISLEESITSISDKWKTSNSRNPDDMNIQSEEEFVKQKKAIIESIARQFEFLNQTLKSALQLLAIVVVFSVLTSSALRESIKHVVEIQDYDIFPAEFSLVYGMYFSLFLCVMYIPVYIYLKSRFLRFKESVANLKEPNDQQWSQTITGIVKFEGTALDNLRIAITMLAPLLSSFLPESFQLFK
ncbi:MAG: hypothetical protein V1775_12370 [Bacteroidota bacterium]